jgi:hypothetical protein
MAVVVKQLTFGDKTYPVVFSSNALFKLEKETGLSTERIGLLLLTGRAGYQMMQIILWAGLEAARIRLKIRREPFTIDEVGDLLDEEGGSAQVWAGEDDGKDGQGVIVREPRPAHPISTAVMEAWQAAFPKQRPMEDGAKSNPSMAAQPGMIS